MSRAHGHHVHEPGAHGHDHRAELGQRRAGEGRRIGAALVITLLLFVAELAGGWLSGSLSLLSDAGHMLSDVAAQGLSLAALLLAARPSDRRRTYGYYRVEILAALANGVALFALSGWILWSAAERLHAGVGEIHAGLMLGVASAGLVGNLVAAKLLHGAESLNVRGAYLHVLQDTLSSVAVLVGGAVIGLFPRAAVLDPLLSIGIALFIVVGAWRLVRDAVDVLLEAAPLGIDLDAVGATIRARQGVRAVHDLHLWTITSGVHALSAHVVVDDLDSCRGHDRLLDELKELLRRDFRIGHTTIQVESPRYARLGSACRGCDE